MRRNRLAVAAVAVCVSICLSLLSGCNTPQQKAYTPQPQSQLPPPQQPPSSASSSESPDAADGSPRSTAEAQAQSDGATDDSGAQQPQADGGQPADRATTPPSDFASGTRMPASDAPDVQITEVPLDENGNPIEPEAQQPAAESGAQKQAATTAGNAPPSGTSPASQAAAAGTAGGRRQATAGSQPAPTIGGSGNPVADARGNVIAIGAQTGEEKLAAANADLDARLASFDELMRRAREAAERQRQAGGGAAGGPGGELDGRGVNQPYDSRRGGGGQAESASGSGYTPEMSGEKSPGDYQHVATGPIPADIPDGRDDDIVARQLREAASRETDPVLREKLWEEYRRYKKGLVGR